MTTENFTPEWIAANDDLHKTVADAIRGTGYDEVEPQTPITLTLTARQVRFLLVATDTREPETDEN